MLGRPNTDLQDATLWHALRNATWLRLYTRTVVFFVGESLDLVIVWVQIKQFISFSEHFAGVGVANVGDLYPSNRIAVVSPDGPFARRRFARSQSRFARKKSRSPGRRVDSPGLIKSWIILMFCWLNLSNIKHLTFPNPWRYQLTVEFNLSRVYCKRTLPMDCCAFSACSTFSCKHWIVMTETILTFWKGFVCLLINIKISVIFFSLFIQQSIKLF